MVKLGSELWHLELTQHSPGGALGREESSLHPLPPTVVPLPEMLGKKQKRKHYQVQVPGLQSQAGMSALSGEMCTSKW